MTRAAMERYWAVSGGDAPVSVSIKKRSSAFGGVVCGRTATTPARPLDRVRAP